MLIWPPSEYLERGRFQSSSQHFSLGRIYVGFGHFAEEAVTGRLYWKGPQVIASTLRRHITIILESRPGFVTTSC